MDRLDYWRQIADDDHALPTDRRLGDLTSELVTMLGSPDPEQRDDLAFATLATWLERGVYDELLTGLGDGLAMGLGQGVGEQGTDTVLRRSFSALALAACLARGTGEDLLPADTVLTWGDRLLSWWVRERDVRGFEPGLGWIHAIAHGADAISELAGSRHLGAPELTSVLDTVADRVLTPGPTWVHGEPDRVAAATLAVLHRDLVSFDVTERWVARIAAGADPSPSPERPDDPFLATGNAQAFLRALHLQTSLGARQPPHRADLLLVLADALRRTNTAYLR